MNSTYAKEVKSSVVEGYVSPDTIIYLLKNQLIDAGLMNHNLKRVISVLIWQLNVERVTNKIRNAMTKNLRESADSLENLLIESSGRYQNWKNKIETLDYDIAKLKQQLEQINLRWGANPALSATPKNGSFIYKQKLQTTSKFKTTDKQKGRDYRGLIVAAKFGDILSPVGFLSPKRKVSCQVMNFTKLLEDRSKGMPAVVEEDPTPPIGKEEKKFAAPDEKAQPKIILPISLDREKEDDETILKTCEYEQLQKSLKDMQMELNYNRTLTTMLLGEKTKNAKQVQELKAEMEQMRNRTQIQMMDENENWKINIKAIRENFDKELTRKQKEIVTLHELLAQWTEKYMDLEKKQSTEAGMSLKELVKKTMEESSKVKGLLVDKPKPAGAVAKDNFESTKKK